jgi:hypothetical protein
VSGSYLPLSGGMLTGPLLFDLGVRSLEWFSSSGELTSNARLMFHENTDTSSTSAIGVEYKSGSGGGSRFLDAAPEYTVSPIYTGRFVLENYEDGFAFHCIEADGDFRFYVADVERFRVASDGSLFVNEVLLDVSSAPAIPDYEVGANWNSKSTLKTVNSRTINRPCPVGGTIKSVTVVTQGGIGSCVIDILKSTYAAYPPTVSICGASLPTISGGTKYQDSVLTGWNTTVNPGDILRFKINSTTVFKDITIILDIEP